MTMLIESLRGSELLLLFAVILSGLALGRISFAGVRLGVAGVLFSGLTLGALLSAPGEALRIAPQLRDVGLVLFVYLVGLASGPGFFTAWQRDGKRLNLVVVLALLAGAGTVLLGGRLLDLDPGFMAGVFSGALTNTPALAAANERLQGTAMASHPAMGYSITYPFGVLGGLALFRILARMRRRVLEEERAHREKAVSPPLRSSNFEITNPEIVGQAIGELRVRDAVGVVISRWNRGGVTQVPTSYTVLAAGDVVTAVGTAEALTAAERFFGTRSDRQLETYREQVDMRRILVSRRDLVGKSIAELELQRRFNAQITRLRRADLDLLPSGDMKLALGDRLRVVAPKSRIPELAAFFGDSEKALAELDFVALAAGIMAGLLLANVPLPAPSGQMKLGIAGGPLLVALVLGRLGRTGPFVWSVPYESSATLRELGLLLFLSGVGVGAGAALGEMDGSSGLAMLGLGVVVTLVTSATVLTLGPLLGRSTFIGSLGAASGTQTQPATLAAAYEISGRSDEVYVAYALVYPVAMIGKILIAQLIALM
ncbi:MAG TPA: TrkA C-terminal domain-containing protein [Longimicrobiales bacterium]|nr:TrkA C-terminal domain-containing protein [Longimicrobiales bacterium]